ncbi:XdhC family protein [Alicyclobacillus fastidiosus]|uniref:XdhC family protein n=1 Tax=Alicyclobacillus fastidiosus TaxID=392011 RepID=UPI0024E13DB3|nr:XdhC family protein [Alicyclobacillus fastidiosus]
MTTIHDFATTLEYCADHGLRAAVAVVVETDGSVYRRAGARSVITEDGQILGVISGGAPNKTSSSTRKRLGKPGKRCRRNTIFAVLTTCFGGWARGVTVPSLFVSFRSILRRTPNWPTGCKRICANVRTPASRMSVSRLFSRAIRTPGQLAP